MRKILLIFCFLISPLFLMAQDITLGNLFNNNIGPFNPVYKNSFVQQIYTKYEINALEAGNISSIKFYTNANNTFLNTNNVRFWIGHTNKTMFSNNTDWVSIENLTLIYNGSIINDNGVFTINFSSPFYYNNIDNIVIVCQKDFTNDVEYASSRFLNYRGDAQNTLNYSSNAEENINGNNYTELVGERSYYKPKITIVGLTHNTIPLCPELSDFNSTNVEVLPTFTWFPQRGAINYNVKIGTQQNYSDILYQTSIIENSITLTNTLKYGTTYYITIESVGIGGGAIGCISKSFKTKNVPCVDFVIENSTNMVYIPLNPIISWPFIEGASGYTINLFTRDGNQLLNTFNVDNVNRFELTSSNILPNTPYTISVLPNFTGYNPTLCTNNINVYTKCDSQFTIPWVDGFENHTLSIGKLANCWESLGSSSYVNNFSSNTLNGQKNLNVSLNTNDHRHNVWIFTPGLQLQAGINYRLKFNYKNGNNNSNNIKIFIGDSPEVLSMKSEISKLLKITNTNYKEGYVDFNVENSSVYYLGFNINKNIIFGSYIFFDDISIDVSPFCPSTGNIYVSEVMSTFVKLNWESVLNNHEIYLTDNDEEPNFYTIPTFTSIQNYLNINSLLPNHEYSAWIRSICGNNKTNWERLNFTTKPLNTFNDYCEDAINLRVGSTFEEFAVVGDNTLATFDYMEGDIYCDGLHTLETRDIWYKVEIPNSGSVIIDTATNNDINMTDTVLNIYTGQCGNLQIDECVEDYRDENNQNERFARVILTNKIPGEIYYIRVFGFRNILNFSIGSFRVSAYDLSTLNNQNFDRLKTIVYPNPFNNFLNITNSDLIKEVVLMDITGKIINRISNPKPVLEINNAKEGIYFFNIQYQNGSKETIKVIKK